MSLHQQVAVDDSETPSYDIIIVGGGINGVGIAALAAEQGLSVLLCEQGDLASATSSASSKLIHGGLRYLENFEWKMVRQSLKEREHLMKIAPHLVRPMRFRMPQKYHLRSSFLLSLGLFLYDNLDYGGSLPRSQRVKFGEGDGLNPDINHGFEYSDCWTDDARLVITNALAAKQRGARIVTRAKCEHLAAENEGWQVTLKDVVSNEIASVHCRCVVNATGPWIGEFNQTQLGTQGRYRIRLVKGSHLVVKQQFHPDKSYLLQAADGRVVFVIPYQHDYTLVGTTDVEFSGDIGSVAISEEETNYLLSVVNNYFEQPLHSQSIVSSFAGVRPLVEDKKDNASKVSRDYRLVLDYPRKKSPILHVYGGKLTTYRLLALKSMKRLKTVFKQLKQPKGRQPLPGGDLQDFSQFIESQRQSYVWLPPELIYRYARNYGTRVKLLLADHVSLDSFGEHFGHGLYQHEVDFLVREEWAKSAEDILTRRTKLGLLFDESQRQRLAAYLG